MKKLYFNREREGINKNLYIGYEYRYIDQDIYRKWEREGKVGKSNGHVGCKYVFFLASFFLVI